MKYFFMVILIFGAFQASAELPPSLKKELKTINYLLKEAESLRFRRLYAAVSAENRALLYDSDEAKQNERQRAERNYREAGYAADLLKALNMRLLEINSDIERDMERSEGCPKQVEQYVESSQYLISLNYSGVIRRDSFEYLERIYSFSNMVVTLACNE